MFFLLSADDKDAQTTQTDIREKGDGKERTFLNAGYLHIDFAGHPYFSYMICDAGYEKGKKATPKMVREVVFGKKFDYYEETPDDQQGTPFVGGQEQAPRAPLAK